MSDTTATLKILSLVEATDINAVAKGVLEFHLASAELRQKDADFPIIEGSLVTFARRSAASGSNAFVSAARAGGLEVELIPERRRFDLSVLPALRKMVEAHNPDIVVTHSVKSHFVLWRSRVWRKYPWVAFHHGYTTTDRKMRVYNRVDRWSLPAADRLITVCQAFARELARNTGVPREKISVQHNSIRPQSENPTGETIRSKIGIDSDGPVVLSVGRLSKEKAHVDLLHAFKQLRETNPELNCRLIFVGDGPERARLEAAAESPGLKDHVVFAGQVSDVNSFYAAADVFVLPSHSEGSPHVLLEAMAAEVPVVATSVGGVPEIVENDVSALLVPAADPTGLASAIARLLADKELAQRLTENAATLVANLYTPENYVRSLVKIYREVIEARNVSPPA
jgi:glycosyltransferase involved in cell wall biosynthesis